MGDRYHHGNLRNALIEKGLKILSRDGIAAFSLRRLSQELGVSHAAAYRHFSGKEDLLRAILDYSARLFREALAAAVRPPTGGREDLYRLGVAYVRFYLKHPEILSLFIILHTDRADTMDLLKSLQKMDLYAAEAGPDKDFQDMDKYPENSSFGIFRRVVAAAWDPVRFKGLTEREILLGYWAKVHGLATLLVTQKNFIEPEELDSTIERVLSAAF